MITVSADNTPTAFGPRTTRARYIIAQPNQSASWQDNKCLILSVGIVTGLIATVFSFIGAWLILPFAGIEITALGGALYIVCRKLNRRHVLRFCGDQLIVEKGTGQPQQIWQLDKHSTAIFIERQRHPWDPIKISLCCHKPQDNTEQIKVEQIPIGDFLNKEDSQQLLAILRAQGLMVRSDSPSGQIDC